MTGAEFITKERDEQLEKHGISVAADYEANANGELLDAATAIIQRDPVVWPITWDSATYKKIRLKPREEQLAIAGAFLAAEIDRLQMSQEEWENYTADDGKLQDL